MAVAISEAREDRIPAIRQMLSSVGLNLSDEKLRNYFFRVPLSESSASVHGGLVVCDGAEVVGFTGLTPCRLLLGDDRVDGYQMGALGLRSGYGSYMFDLIDAVKTCVKDSFVVANTANAKSAALWTGYGGFESGPSACSSIRYDISGVAFLTRPSTAPDSASVRDFLAPEMHVFWEHMQKNNRDLLMVREPQRLSRIWGKAHADGNLVLLTVSTGGEIAGYAVLRASRLARTPYKRLMIVDVVALGNRPETVEALLRKIRSYARWHGGVLLEYVGSCHGLTGLWDRYLPRSRRALANTALWYTDIPKLKDRFRQDSGWFFGPYDGDRCV